jgi:hypothetical protein
MRAEGEKPLHTGANFFVPTLVCTYVRSLALVRYDGGTGPGGAKVEIVASSVCPMLALI